MRTASDGDVNGMSARRRSARGAAAKLGIASIAAVGSLALSSKISHAATLNWDPGFANAAGGSDGPGTWNTTTADWYKPGTGDTTWSASATNPDTAVFGAGGSGNIVTIDSGGIYVSALSFSSGSYTLSGGQLTSGNGIGTGYLAVTLASGATAVLATTINASAQTPFYGLGTIVNTGFLNSNLINLYSGVTLEDNTPLAGTTVSQLGATTSTGIRVYGSTFRYTGAGGILKNGVGFYTGGGLFDVSNTSNVLTVSPSNVISAADAARTITLGGTGSAFTQGGLVNQTGGVLSVVKTGSGTWTVNANSTYTGGLSVLGGTMLAQPNTTTGDFGVGNVMVGSGATVGSNGASTNYITISSGTLTLNSGSAITPALKGAVGKLSSVGGIVLGNSVKLYMDLGAPTITGGVTQSGGVTSDLLSTSALTLGTGETIYANALTGLKPGTFHLIDYSGALTDNSIVGGNSFSGWTVQGFGGAVYSFGFGTDNGVNSIDVTFTAVPEPASVAAIGLAGAGLLARRKQRRVKHV